MTSSIITLLTDFGNEDYFVGAMKGAILSVNNNVNVVDITHSIAPHDIQAGAFTLLTAYRSFPRGTIHCAVIDPGVGSPRRPVLITCRDYLLVGPDNGLFSYICDREGDFSAIHVTNEKYFLNSVSTTFHGRDVFAPVAAALAGGISPSEMGPVIRDVVRLHSLAPRAVEGGGFEASIIHIDRFGNCVTNITREHLGEREIARKSMRLRIGSHEISNFKPFFAQEKPERYESDKLFAIWGSAGFLEIAAFCDSAARLIEATRGQKVELLLQAR